jgi:hypothetical protein
MTDMDYFNDLYKENDWGGRCLTQDSRKDSSYNAPHDDDPHPPTHLYFYVRGNMGLSSTLSFTRDQSKWMTFLESEIGDYVPYGASKKGAFVDTCKY